jgi:hypothetical protein
LYGFQVCQCRNSLFATAGCVVATSAAATSAPPSSAARASVWRAPVRSPARRNSEVARMTAAAQEVVPVGEERGRPAGADDEERDGGDRATRRRR